MSDVLNLPLDETLTTYIIIPLFIFFARIIDVSIGTVRIIMISRGNRLSASVLGFFEIIIWLSAIAQIFQNLTNVACYAAYGAGFAIGNYVGISIENRLAMGVQAVQIIAPDKLNILSMVLREEGFGVTNLKANGQKGEMDFIHIVTPRRRTKDVLHIVKQFDPKAFISVTDIRSAHAGYFGVKSKTSWWPKGIAKKK